MDSQLIAMYDVRGIQKYIYQTAKVKDAMGASLMVENIIEDALRNAVETEGLTVLSPKEFSNEDRRQIALLEWKDDNAPFPYEDSYNAAVEVLFIGGGNAYVRFRSKDLYVRVNRKMSYYVLEKTYSLQLASAVVEKTDNYARDYTELNIQMGKVKSEMVLSKPLGALPIMQTEIKTGYPIAFLNDYPEPVSTESLLKKGGKERGISEEDEKLFDNLVLDKGKDSTLAVVHMDGNNMGLRIRELISGLTSYNEAVTVMRSLSFQIENSYRKVFDDMCHNIPEKAAQIEEFSKKKNKPFVRRIVTAGDDITYVCTAKIALATVEYFCKNISSYTLNGELDMESQKKYGFSVCAGVAFMGSHFPFSVAYEVAEDCCKNAKKRAKIPKNQDGDRIGNFVDFQFCRNVHVLNLKRIRQSEYITGEGQQLLMRPYFIPCDKDAFLQLKDVDWNFEQLRKAVLYFQKEDGFPRSFAKKLRNTYPMGKHQLEPLMKFLQSRGWAMPDQKQGGDELFNKSNVAKWYDALEVMDDYIDLQKIMSQEEVNEDLPE